MSQIPNLFGENSCGFGLSVSPQKTISNKNKESWTTREIEEAFENAQKILSQVPIEIDNKIQHLKHIKSFLIGVSENFKHYCNELIKVAQEPDDEDFFESEHQDSHSNKSSESVVSEDLLEDSDGVS